MHVATRSRAGPPGSGLLLHAFDFTKDEQMDQQTGLPPQSVFGKDEQQIRRQRSIFVKDDPSNGPAWE